jgi:hypothetical protein
VLLGRAKDSRNFDVAHPVEIFWDFDFFGHKTNSSDAYHALRPFREQMWFVLGQSII